MKVAIALQGDFKNLLNSKKCVGIEITNKILLFTFENI